MGKLLMTVLHIFVAVFLVVNQNYVAAMWSVIALLWWLDGMREMEKRYEARREYRKELLWYLEQFESLKGLYEKLKKEHHEMLQSRKQYILKLEAELKSHRTLQSANDKKNNELKSYFYIATDGKMYVWDETAKKIVKIVSKQLKVKSA